MAFTENELYEEWRNAPEGTRSQIESKLAAALKSHALQVLWSKTSRHCPEHAAAAVAQALSKIDSFRGEAKLSTWFHRIVINVANTALQETMREREQDELSEEMSVEPQDVDWKIAYAQIKNRLPADEQALLDCKREGLNVQEIAERIGETPTWVRVNWMRLKKKIRQDHAAVERR